jgi:hypothetical protein
MRRITTLVLAVLTVGASGCSAAATPSVAPTVGLVPQTAAPTMASVAPTAALTAAPTATPIPSPAAYARTVLALVDDPSLKVTAAAIRYDPAARAVLAFVQVKNATKDTRSVTTGLSRTVGLVTGSGSSIDRTRPVVELTDVVMGPGATGWIIAVLEDIDQDQLPAVEGVGIIGLTSEVLYKGGSDGPDGLQGVVDPRVERLPSGEVEVNLEFTGKLGFGFAIDALVFDLDGLPLGLVQLFVKEGDYTGEPVTGSAKLPPGEIGKVVLRPGFRS